MTTQITQNFREERGLTIAQARNQVCIIFGFARSIFLDEFPSQFCVGTSGCNLGKDKTLGKDKAFSFFYPEIVMSKLKFPACGFADMVSVNVAVNVAPGGIMLPS